MPDAPWIVLKFGGTSVSTPDRWRTIADVVRDRLEAGYRPVLVCSALSGVSDRLEQALDGEASVPATLDAVRAQHVRLADAVGVDAEAVLADPLSTLEDRLYQALNEAGGDLSATSSAATRTNATTASPTAAAPTGVASRHRAAVMAMGEILATRLGAALLDAERLSSLWADARKILTAQDESTAPQRRYLSATCSFFPDTIAQAHLTSRLEETGADVLLTQGFIASNAAGETVLLGRGGSDTSAAYLAAKLEAERLEIWTDVPGLFTANPREVPSARLIRQVGYDEAQELATMGAKVLHPRCLTPVQRHGIPLHIRSTDAPGVEGTVISNDAPDTGPQIKAISSKTDVTAIAMETLGMWQEVGFLADVFTTFKHHGLSVDLIATSEANVTVTLDEQPNALDAAATDQLLRDLNRFCTARTIEPCAVVSLVGRNIRALLDELGGTLEAFEGATVHLVSQAASDLNFSFVVDAAEAQKLVRTLHAQLFGARDEDAVFGPRWNELAGVSDASDDPPASWWHERRDALLALARSADGSTPQYVYDTATLDATVERVQRLGAVDRLHYAVKANPNPDVLRRLHEHGVRFECVSPGEVERVQSACPDAAPEEILFQPNFAGIDEYAAAFDRGVQVTLDSLHPLEHHPDVFAGQSIIVRMDPGKGAGHHRHVRTAGTQSKFGVPPGRLEMLHERAEAAGARIIGLHAHVGSGIVDAETWGRTARQLARWATDLPDAHLINVGGGLGVPYRPSDATLDLDALDGQLTALKADYPDLDLWMEPGRYLVAEAGVLLARVTQTKRKGPVDYVGVDAGMHTLLRPALYGAYHEIANLSRLGDPPAITADVVGPICESGDVLGHSRRLPATEEGDVLLIAMTGAYGAAMQNDYNLRRRADETLLAAE